jgi:hypothetical protein
MSAVPANVSKTFTKLCLRTSRPVPITNPI